MGNKKYFGSVRFFKHLFLLILLLMIIVPTVLCVVFGIKMQKQSEDIVQLKVSYQESLADAGVVIDANGNDDGQVLYDNNSFELPEYYKLYENLYSAYPTLFKQTKSNTLYLTFNGGPSDVTDDILDILKEKGIKATFFIVGSQVQTDKAKERLQRIVDDGHVLGIESYSGVSSTIYKSVESYLEDFNNAYTLIEEITGVKVEVFRFPDGSINVYNGQNYRDIIAEMIRRGFVYYDWNASGNDENQYSDTAEVIVNAATTPVNSHRVVLLLHDSTYQKNTALALPEIIDYYINAGYVIAPITKDVQPVIFGY